MKSNSEFEGGHASEGLDRELLKAALRLNTMVLGLVCGLVAAGTLFLSTHISMGYWGEDAGGYLGLLGVFLPGYSVSAGGAWIGALWAFLFAALGGSLSYHSYGKLLGERLAVGSHPLEETSDPILNPAILRLHGLPLGLSIGGAVGAALFFSTGWLIVRGTADNSVHAGLLSNYLPGYSVSYGGAILGALELFVFVFLCCALLAGIYNKVVALRAR